MSVKIVEFTLKPTDVPYMARTHFAEYLHLQGFEPNHWHANWKRIQPYVWLLFTGDDRSSEKMCNREWATDDPRFRMYVEVLLRDNAPNCGGTSLVMTMEVEKEIKNKIVPLVLEILTGYTDVVPSPTWFNKNKYEVFDKVTDVKVLV